MDEVVDIETVAKAMGISPKALKNRISEGRDHPPYIAGTRPKRFLKETVLKWMKRNEVKQLNEAS